MRNRLMPRFDTLLLRKCRVPRLVDALARWAAVSRVPGLSLKPLPVDSTYFGSRHVSRHYERRCRDTAKGKKGKATGKKNRKGARRGGTGGRGGAENQGCQAWDPGADGRSAAEANSGPPQFN